MTKAAPSAEQLLESIKPGMKLDKNIFLRIYAYTFTNPEYKQTALDRLKEAGCSRAEEYYNQIIGEYERRHEEELQPVFKWYKEQCEKDFERMMKRSEKHGNCRQQSEYIFTGLPQDW